MSTLTQAAAGITERIRSMAERPHSLTMREIIDRYMAQYAGRDTALPYRLQIWQHLIGDFTLEKIDSDLVHAAREELAKLPALSFRGRDHEGERIFKTKPGQKTKSPATLNKFMSNLGSVCTWAIQARITPRAWVHPCRGIRRLPEPSGRVRFLSDEERTRLLAECKKSKYPRMYAMVLTAMLTGARLGELLSLRWCDMDLENATAPLGRTKNGDRRTLVLLPQVVAALRPFESSDKMRFVFGAMQTRQQTPCSIKKTWEKALERAAIENFRFHDLRHCCASYLAQAGVPLNVIADVLGHRKMDMTRRYAHLTTQTKATAMQAALGKIGAIEIEARPT